MFYLKSILARIAWPIRSFLASPVQLLSAPRAILGLSLPTRVALLVFVCLLVVGAAVFYETHDRASLPPRQLMIYSAIVFALMIVIPLVVRQAIKLWIEGPPSRFPDLDEAWKEGLSELEKQGLDIAQLPIYLIQATEDADQIDTLMRAARQPFLVKGAPQRATPLRFYASTEVVFLVLLTELSQLAAVYEAGTLSTGGESASRESMRDVLSQTLAAMDLDALRGGGTAHIKPQMSKTGTDTPGVPASSGGEIDFSATVMPGNMSLQAGQFSSGPRRVRVDGARQTLIGNRLRHVCRLLSRERQPLAPLNGQLVLLPLDLVAGRGASQEDVQLALHEDLETLRRTLGLRYPVIALITGMEEELGFRELVRRIGVEKAQASRFGKRCHVGTPPLADHVEAIAANACASFEIWAYSLFREEGGVSAYGNPKLYALICRMRSELRDRIENILAYAFGRDSSQTAEDALLFAGCYFAATGQQTDLQAFIRGVFDRFIDRQECLEDYLDWTESSKHQESWYQTLAQGGFVIDGALLLVFIVLLLRALGIMSG